MVRLQTQRHQPGNADERVGENFELPGNDGIYVGFPDRGVSTLAEEEKMRIVDRVSTIGTIIMMIAS